MVTTFRLYNNFSDTEGYLSTSNNSLTYSNAQQAMEDDGTAKFSVSLVQEPNEISIVTIRNFNFLIAIDFRYFLYILLTTLLYH